MGLTKIAINLAAKNEKIESFSSYLFVGPHPDDLEIGAGATISRLASLGKKTTFLICTDGRFGKENIDPDTPWETLVAMRREECLRSAKLLGVSDVRFLNLSDGKGYATEELLQGIAKTINEVKPDVVFAPDPDVPSECHADHLQVGNACKELSNFANYPEIFARYLNGVPASSDINVRAICLYMTARPNAFVKTSGHFKNQLRAIACHASQYPSGHPATDTVTLYLRLRATEYGLKTFSRTAEGFRMMNRTRMHCLPEASL